MGILSLIFAHSFRNATWV